MLDCQIISVLKPQILNPKAVKWYTYTIKIAKNDCNRGWVCNRGGVSTVVGF